jgi:hypothetical protein
MTVTAHTVASDPWQLFVVLAILNVIAWWRDAPRAHDLAVSPAGFLLGAFGIYLSAYINGYRRTA